VDYRKLVRGPGGDRLDELTVEIPGAMEGLALRVPDSWQAVELPDNVRMIGDVLIFDTLSGKQELTLHVKTLEFDQGSD
jgi:hypothetical protein